MFLQVSQPPSTYVCMYLKFHPHLGFDGYEPQLYTRLQPHQLHVFYELHACKQQLST